MDKKNMLPADMALESIEGGKQNPVFLSLYAKKELERHRERYKKLLLNYRKHFGNQPVSLFSTPGRTELGGNHTDHNHGRVLAAGIQLDSIAAASGAEDNTVTLYSEGFGDVIKVNLDNLKKERKEKGTSRALIRGIAARLKERGYRIGGFSSYQTTEVMPGSGLSSSAAFEVLIGTIFNNLYNNGNIDPVEIAKTGQYSENNYFGKPCGLMDQVVCASGGIVSIDFASPEQPVIEKVLCDFQSFGYNLLIVDTGGSHVDLTPDYAAVPAEMKAVASALGKSICRQIDRKAFLYRIGQIRAKTGDRPLLRCLHFLNENERVIRQVAALKEKDMEKYLCLVTASGDSSWKYLQNCYSSSMPFEQGVTLALALTEEFLAGKGACRVHGGGFAGTIQVYMPLDKTDEYIKYMEGIFGKGSVTALRIREKGPISIFGTGNDKEK